MTLHRDTEFYYSPTTDGITFRQSSEKRYPLTRDDYRRLVVVDPEDCEQIERLAEALATNGAHRGRLPKVDEAIRVADALRSLVAPPRPDEPGRWGVVEAACVHSDVRRTWTRDADGNWWVVGTNTRPNPDDWDSLVDPVVIREGIDQ